MKRIAYLVLILMISSMACSLEINTDDNTDAKNDSPQLSVDCPDPIEYVEEPTPTPYGVLSISPSQQAEGCVFLEPNSTVTITLPDAPQGFQRIEFWYIPDNPEALRGDVIGVDEDSSDGANITFAVYGDMYGYVYVQGVGPSLESGSGFTNEPLMISTRQE